MTLISAKTIRADLVTRLKAVHDLQTDPDGTAHVYPYYSTNPQGISPYCCVETVSPEYNLKTSPGTLTPFRFTVTFWILMDGDKAAAENDLDDLALALANILVAMHNANFYQPPESDYVKLIGGRSYKFMMFFVEISR